MTRLNQKYLVKIVVIPKCALLFRFFEAVDGILAQVENPLIGVVCTYGNNRGGQMIVRYLIKKLGWTPAKAIQEFNEARGYPITRELNLRSL